MASGGEERDTDAQELPDVLNEISGIIFVFQSITSVKRAENEVKFFRSAALLTISTFFLHPRAHLTL